MLQFLPYALAAYGGYKGYRSAKESGASGLGSLFGALTGGAMGYYGGKGVLGGGAALGAPGFAQAQQSFTPFTQLGSVQSLGGTAAGRALGLSGASQTYGPIEGMASPGGSALPKTGGGISNIFNTLLRKPKTYIDAQGVERVVQTAAGEDVMQFDPFKVGAAVGLGTYLGGAFDPKPQDIFTPTYNLAVAELQKQRGGFKYIDPVTGEEKTFDQPYIPEAGRTPQYTMGPYELQKSTFNEGGLAEIQKFNEGGINYLPSKVTHDENDSNNYMRAQGYVEDGSGNGDKDEDTMLAQLADGEFVTRADGVLGAGIIAGANPKSMKDMREKGAQYFYEQQKRFKRIFDLLEGSKNAKATIN